MIRQMTPPLQFLLVPNQGYNCNNISISRTYIQLQGPQPSSSARRSPGCRSFVTGEQYSPYLIHSIIFEERDNNFDTRQYISLEELDNTSTLDNISVQRIWTITSTLDNISVQRSWTITSTIDNISVQRGGTILQHQTIYQFRGGGQ